MADQQGRWEFTFDSLDRVTNRTDPASRSFEWAYDALGQRQLETDADSGHTYFDYDALARLATIKNPQAEEFGFGYDDASRLVRKALASGALTYHSYDAAGRPSRIAHANRHRRFSGLRRPPRDRRRDSAGDGPTRLEMNASGADAARMCRDSGGTVQDRKLYFYDPASNRERMEQDGQPTIYYHYDARNAMTQVDPAGGASTDLEWNAAGQLVKKTAGSDETYFARDGSGLIDRIDLPSGLSNYFEYDGDLRRWSKADSTGFRHYRWSARKGGRPGWSVVQEAAVDGATLRSYTTARGSRRRGKGLQAIHDSAASTFVQTDEQGSTRKVTGADESVVGSLDYDRFVVVTGESGTTPSFQWRGTESDEDPGTDHLGPGEEYDPDDGIIDALNPIAPGDLSPACAEKMQAFLDLLNDEDGHWVKDLIGFFLSLCVSNIGGDGSELLDPPESVEDISDELAGCMSDMFCPDDELPDLPDLGDLFPGLPRLPSPPDDGSDHEPPYRPSPPGPSGPGPITGPRPGGPRPGGPRPGPRPGGPRPGPWQPPVVGPGPGTVIGPGTGGAVGGPEDCCTIPCDQAVRSCSRLWRDLEREHARVRQECHAAVPWWIPWAHTNCEEQYLVGLYEACLIHGVCIDRFAAHCNARKCDAGTRPPSPGWTPWMHLVSLTCWRSTGAVSRSSPSGVLRLRLATTRCVPPPI
jgi:YD repeat-containing protein